MNLCYWYTLAFSIKESNISATCTKHIKILQTILKQQEHLHIFGNTKYYEIKNIQVLSKKIHIFDKNIYAILICAYMQKIYF